MSLASARVVALVGNPRPASRTHQIGAIVADALARALGWERDEPVDLALLGPRVLDPGDRATADALERTIGADALVVASPTYKATYTGLLKAFLDRVPTPALRDTFAVPVMLGGAPSHALAVDVHFTPLLLELGARVPARGLFVLESELEAFPARAAAWACEFARIVGAAREPALPGDAASAGLIARRLS
jgi:FMN reductase